MYVSIDPAATNKMADNKFFPMRISFSFKTKKETTPINPSIDPNPNLGSGAFTNQKIIPANNVIKTSSGIKPDRSIFLLTIMQE